MSAREEEREREREGEMRRMMGSAARVSIENTRRASSRSVGGAIVSSASRRRPRLITSRDSLFVVKKYEYADARYAPTPAVCPAAAIAAPGPADFWLVALA